MKLTSVIEIDRAAAWRDVAKRANYEKQAALLRSINEQIDAQTRRVYFWQGLSAILAAWFVAAMVWR